MLVITAIQTVSLYSKPITAFYVHMYVELLLYLFCVFLWTFCHSDSF